MSTRNAKYKQLCFWMFVFFPGAIIAQQAPFTLQVPVELRDMHPDIQSGNLSCQVLDDRNAPVAGGTAEFGIDRRSRSFAQTVQVNARLADGRSPLDARRYECALGLRAGEENRYIQPGTSRAQGDVRFEPAPGAPFAPTVSGVIASSLPQAPGPEQRLPIR